ncbi:MAG TPA: sulfatase [Planctomycetaceae bacterium]|nr:sulfatase [Planctomycetaceae bacterium]
MSNRILKLLCVLVGSACCSVTCAKETLPNIVLIISDDQAWNDYGFMGHPHIETPSLDRLAKGGVTFKRGYVPTALCRPSLMTIMTGLYASQHGVTGNDPSPKYAKKGSPEYNENRARLIAKIDQTQTLAELLSAKGYLSHQSGKWWEGNFRRGGFTHGMARGFPQPGGRHGDDGLKIGREGLEPVEEFIDMAVEQDKPFFLWYAPFLPHTPHNPPDYLLEKYTSKGLKQPIAKYYAMCDWFDETCGQLIDYLDSADVRQNTIIVYVTDNGWIQNPEKNGYAPRSKQTAYEGGIRTPIIFNWPGRLQPAMRDELASSIDLFPTIAAMVGATPSEEDLPGLDLWPALQDKDAAIDRDVIYGESFAHDVANIDDPEQTLLYRWCIDGKWKLLLTYDGEINRYKATHPRDVPAAQLYDLLADPDEKHDLASELPQVVERLKKKIDGWYVVETPLVSHSGQ